jgi:hypothetical protein
MSRLELRLSLEAVLPLVEHLRPMARALRGTHANPVSRGERDDPELRELLLESTLDEQRADLELFLRVFGTEFSVEGRIVVDEHAAERLLRACAALRLHLRENALASVPDGALETGEVPFDDLGPPERLAYACYGFLATLQELLVEFLDPLSGP